MMSDPLKAVLWSTMIVLAFIPIERLFPADRHQPMWGRVANLCYMPVIVGLTYALLPITNAIATQLLLSSAFLPKFAYMPTEPQAIVLTSFVFAIVWDVWQYWVHRLQHTTVLLWPTHEFHHSETAMNASTHARTHVASSVLYALLWLPMVTILGSLAPHWLAAFLMFRFWGYVIHSNLRLNLGWLTPVIAGPQFHRIHHSKLPQHLDKNFATLFPVLDVVFGTFYWPARDEYPETGLAVAKDVGFFEQATIEPGRMWFALWRRRSV